MRRINRAITLNPPPMAASCEPDCASALH